METASSSQVLVRCWCQACSGDFVSPRCERDHRKWPRDTEAITKYHQKKTGEQQQQVAPAAVVAVNGPGQQAATPVLGNIPQDSEREDATDSQGSQPLDVSAASSGQLELDPHSLDSTASADGAEGGDGCWPLDDGQGLEPSVAEPSEEEEAEEAEFWGEEAELEGGCLPATSGGTECLEKLPPNLHDSLGVPPDLQGPLFDGDQCRMTVAAAILVLQDLGGRHNFSKLALDELYQLLADQLLPIGNRLPRSFYKVAKALSSFGVTYSQVPACPADCALLEKQHQDATQCPVCEVDVMLSSKVFHRSSLITSLRRMFLSPDVSRLLRAHQQAPAGSGRLHDVWDGRRVEELRHKYPDFFADRRNILLGVCIDGLNPHNSGTVSITPIVLQVFNLPPEVRTRASNLILYGVIGGKRKPKSLQAYIQSLVDELQVLWEGVDTFDSASGTRFTLRAMLLVSLHDYPGYRDLALQHDAGNLRGCVKCDIRGMYITGLHKYTYGDHRRLLPMSHPFRHDGRWGDACNVPQCLKNSHSSLCRAEAAVAAARARGISANAADDPAKATGVTGLPALTQLVYWDWARCELVDAMHCNFNQAKRMEDNLLGKRDDLEVRLDLQQLGRQPELWPRNNQALPPAPWVFTLSGHKRASAWLASLRVPSAFNADPKRLFFMKQRSGDGPSADNATAARKTSHDYLVLLTSGILARAADLGLGEAGRAAAAAIDSLAGCWQRLLDPVIQTQAISLPVDRNKLACKYGGGSRLYACDLACSYIHKDLDRLDLDVREALCSMELAFPRSEWVIMVHLMAHFVDQIRDFGPVRATWMYPQEGFLGHIKRAVKNR